MHINELDLITITVDLYSGTPTPPTDAAQMDAPCGQTDACEHITLLFR